MDSFHLMIGKTMEEVTFETGFWRLMDMWSSKEHKQSTEQNLQVV